MDKFELEPINAFKTTLLETSVDMTTDVAEIVLDDVLKDDLWQNLPIISYGVKVGKGFISLKNAISAKKALVFIQQFQSKNLDEEKVKKHISSLKQKPKKLNKELELILDVLDKQTGYTKSKIIANFYFHYLNEDICWNDFCILIEITNNLYISDIDILKDLNEKEVYLKDDNFDVLAVKRLDNCNLIDYFNGMLIQLNGQSTIRAKINIAGKVFVKYGLKNIRLDEENEND